MNILIKQSKILDPGSKHNGKTMDILIENGLIKSISNKIHFKGKTFTANNLHISPGWFDMHVNFRDPGDEQKEDIISGCRAAAYGGFTGVACMPGTNPPLHTKADIEYVKNKANANLVDVYPIGAISHNLEGKEMTELYDMHLSGAVAFSDDKKSVANAGLLFRSLLYINGFNGLIISHSEDKDISLDGKMNESEMSTSLGLTGMPGLAEEIIVSRNVSLAEYTKARLHFATVSTARSVEIIRNAKKQGIRVTAEVTAHHLSLDDSALEEFDTNFKVNPPLRGKKDVKALVKGLSDGTIDAICSDHAPEDIESKKREFDGAAFGAIGLETAYAAANTFSQLTPEQLVDKLSISPRRILGVNIPCIRVGEKANFTLFNPKLKWTFTEKDIRSKSTNSPFKDREFTGKALGVYNNGKFMNCCL